MVLAQEQKTQLNEDQRRAKDNTLRFWNEGVRVVGVIGSAGTGKSFSATEILKGLPGKTLCLAPTNTAVKQLKNSVERSNITAESMTNAKALGLIPEKSGAGELEFKQRELGIDEENPLESASTLWIDEGSMIDARIFDQILSQTSAKRILITLDQWQLPPVGSKEIVALSLFGNYYSELLKTERYSQDDYIYQVIVRALSAVKSKEEGFSVREQFPNSREGYNVLSKQETLYQMALRVLKMQHSGKWDSFRAVCWRNKEVFKLNQQIRQTVFGRHSIQTVLPGDLLVATGAVQRKEQKLVNGKVYENKVTIYPTSSYMVVNSAKTETVVDSDGKEWKIWKAQVFDPDEFPKTVREVQVIDELFRESYQQKITKIKGQMYKEYGVSGKSPAWRTLLAKLQDLETIVDPIRHGYAITAHGSQGMSVDSVFINDSDIRCNKKDIEVRNRAYFVGCSRARNEIFVL